MTIQKANKPDGFRELYGRANPLPGATPKVPVLQIKSPLPSTVADEIILCESTVITEYIAATMGYNCDLHPESPRDRAKVRLFQEVCGSSFDSFVPLTRVQNTQQLESEYMKLQDNMQGVNAYLNMHGSLGGPFLMGDRFSLAEVHLAPFVQRCCGILPPPYDPMSICRQLELDHLETWISALLEQESVKATASRKQVERSREKLTKRLIRIQAAA